MRKYTYFWRVAAFMIISGSIAHAAKDKAKEEPKPIVFIETAKSDDLFDVLTYPGRAVPKIHATLRSDIDGVINKIYSPLGKSVHRGERLLIIKHTDPVYQYAPVVVSTPVNGTVSSVNVTIGSHVSKGQELATVTDPAQIKITTEIAGTDLYTLGVGANGDFYLPNQTEPIKVKITGISPFVDSSTGTATCELEPQGKAVLPPGAMGRLEFKVNERKGYLVPEDSLIYLDQKPFVRVVQNGKVKLNEVKLGHTYRGKVEILTGLTKDDRLVLRASRYIGDGEPVEIFDDEKKDDKKEIQ